MRVLYHTGALEYGTGTYAWVSRAQQSMCIIPLTAAREADEQKS